MPSKPPPVTSPPAPPGGREPAKVEQPPRAILRGGAWVDITGLTGDGLYEALISDEEVWDYPRLAAETGRKPSRLRTWVHNAYIEQRTGRAPDDITFIVPEEPRIGGPDGAPWWRAGRAREALINKIGCMSRDGRALPPSKSTGRRPGTRDSAPRKPREDTPARDQAPGVYDRYVRLTTGERAVNDRTARAKLADEYGLNRLQIANRLKIGEDLAITAYRRHAELVAELTAGGLSADTAGEEALTIMRRESGGRLAQIRRQVELGQRAAAAAPAEVDNQTLLTRYEQLFGEFAKRYKQSGADDRARAALAEETRLSRREIAARITAARESRNKPTGPAG